MLKHGVQVYFRILQGCMSAYGIFSIMFFQWLFIVPVYLLFIYSTLILDRLLFTKYKKIEIKKPIFIFGHPRSGTTLLHRVLTEAQDYVTFQYWEMKFPALITRKIANWITALLVKLKKDIVFPNTTGHETRLNSVEEEDLLFFLLLDTLFLIFLSPVKFNRKNKVLEEVMHDFQEHREQSVLFLKECFKRQAYYKNKDRVVAKMNTSILRIQTLYKIFPDAKFIYLLRNPLEAIPSSHSLIHKLQEYDTKQNMDATWYERRGFKRQDIAEKLYNINLLFYTHFYESVEQGKIPKSQISVVKYTDLCNDFENTIEKVRIFAELDFSEETKRKIKEQAAKQKNYKRQHEVESLEKLNLSEERIRKDLAFLFEPGNLLSLN
jgi:hypothetical protein